MGRWRQRVCLEDGLKLDLNKLLRAVGTKREGSWRLRSRWGQRTAHSKLCLGGDLTGSLTLSLGQLEQTIELRAEPRHFGGVQWYFVCPVLGRNVSVLWLLPGAKRFVSHASPFIVAAK